MSTRPFDPKFMKVGVLTAALQELTPREVRDPDPDKAIEDWLEFARDLGANYIQLSAALHPSQSDVPPEAMLDPVANTMDLRDPFDAARARRGWGGGAPRSQSDVPPEAMLDPVANTMDLRDPFDAARARRVQAALKATGVGLSDVGYFEN